MIPKNSPIFLQKLVLILLNFPSQNYSIINTFCITSLNINKLHPCTPIHWRLSNGTKIVVGVLWFGRPQHDKQNKKTFYLINRWQKQRKGGRGEGENGGEDWVKAHGDISFIGTCMLKIICLHKNKLNFSMSMAKKISMFLI
jgi:hypothetical protein